MSEKPKKPQKLKSRLPRGLVDRGAADIAATRKMLATIQKVYELYGFEPVETPAIEYTDCLGKFLPDQDRPNEGVFSFQDDDEQWLSLRYDLTAPLARYVADKIGKEDFVLPYRSYRAGYVYRNEKPGPGRFRQFMQFDADTVGSSSPASDAEICMMAADAMEALGFERGQYVVKVNNRKVLDGVMEAIGLGGDENAGRRLTVLRAIDKRDKFPDSEIRKLLGPGRWDGGEEGKGDFTKGAGLSNSQADDLLRCLNSTVKQNGTQIEISRVSPSDNFVEGATYLEGVAELQMIGGLIAENEYSDRVKIDFSVVRGLEYYTGPVFEVELLIETKDDKGRPVRFGSVGGGGRYDGLVSRFRGEPVPATGFSIGVSRLQAALDLINANKGEATKPFGPVVVTIMDRDRVADYQRLVKMLRDEGIRAELYLGNANKGPGHQLTYANKRNSPCAIIQGSVERDHASGTPHLIVQDLIAGRDVGADTEDRDAYLKAKSAVKDEVPVENLVDAVRAVLARHNVTWD